MQNFYVWFDFIIYIFKIKLDELIKDFKKNKIFGFFLTIVYVIKYQKWYLFYIYILFWLYNIDKLFDLLWVDKFVNIKYLDSKIDFELFEII